MHEELLRTLREDGPQTDGELAARFSASPAVVLVALAFLVFERGVVTCKMDGGPARRVYVAEAPSREFLEARA